MNIYVMVDMEGISGVCRREQVMGEGEQYQTARKYYTEDTNACIRGLVKGGAKKIFALDAHGGGSHFIWEQLDERAEYIRGDAGKRRMPWIEDFDGLVLLGYHAMAGTPEAVLEHTMSSAHWQNCWLNGEKCGETAIDAGIAGDHDVPLIMVSGDDKLCAEAKALVPGVHAAQVKVGLACYGARLLPMKKAHKVIEDTAAVAIKDCKKMKPYRPKRPVTMRLELVSRGKVPAEGSRPWLKIIDGRTYEVTGDGVEEAFWRLAR